MLLTTNGTMGPDERDAEIIPLKGVDHTSIFIPQICSHWFLLPCVEILSHSELFLSLAKKRNGLMESSLKLHSMWSHRDLGGCSHGTSTAYPRKQGCPDSLSPSTVSAHAAINLKATRRTKFIHKSTERIYSYIKNILWFDSYCLMPQKENKR